MKILLDNGVTLIDPIFIGDNWFIRCDDDEGCRLIIKSKAVRLKSIRERANRILPFNLKLMPLRDDEDCVVTHHYRSQTAFPPKYEGIFDCWNLGVEVLGPLDASIPVTHSGMEMV